MAKAGQDNSDLRLMGLAMRNPSLGGRDLMLEIIERSPMPEEKAGLVKKPKSNHSEGLNSVERNDGQITERGFGKAPRDSRSFREYMANMGHIERQLLNEAVTRLKSAIKPRKERSYDY